jgi:hypothetical protein
MADKRKAGLAFAQAFKQADAEATAALAAKKAERMAQLVESERALPLRLPRATPKTKQELGQHAERVGRQMLGEHVTSGKKGDTKNLAGRSMRENERIKALEYELAPTKDIPASTEYESRIGDINVAFPGDYTVSDVELKSLRGKPVGSKQQGGSRYGLGKMDRDDPLFWASSEMPAQLAQDKITDVAHLFDTDRVMAEHLAMGPVATNFAQHFADANLRAIDYSKLRKKDMKLFDDIIAGGYDKKNPKTGVIETVAFPNWPGIADPEMAYQAMKRDPELRKWFNSRMKTPKVTEATNMPNGLDVQWAITSPDLRNMEVNLTGHSVGEMVPSAKLTDTAEHETYAKGIRGKYAGHQGVLTPFSISYPDAAQHIASTQRPQDFTGTIQKVFPHQIVDQQYLDEYGEYKRQLDRIIRGKKKGGEVSKDSDYQARLDAMLGKHMADGGGAFKKIQYKAAGGIAYKKMQFKAEGGGIDNEMPDVSDNGDIMFAPKYASGGAIHHGIKPLQWKAGGGWAKAGKAIQKAAKEAGAKTAPQTAEKDLTNIQDFHTSLMDTVRDRAIKAKQEMDAFDYKYDKGQRVFTDSSAKRNKPPYEIIERSRHGHHLVWEGEPWRSPKVIDPETGKAKRTPYEPGYKVRSENPETGEWQEFILPETAIRGDVEMAKGGLSKLSNAVAKASKEADVVINRDANLKKFLEKSKVTDPVFHAAKTDVKEFSPKHRTELSSMGHHFGTSDQANFRTGQYDFESEAPNIGKYHLNVENPLEVSHMASFAPDHLADTMMDMNILAPEKYDALAQKHNYDSVRLGDELVKILKKNGYDGLKYPNEREGEGFSYVPFSPTQIKSATGNRGTYDPTSPELSKAKGGLTKLNKAVAKASKEADAKLAEKAIEAPSIIIPSKVSNVKDAMRKRQGEFGARRVERAADEVPNLEGMYQEEALKQAFGGDNAKAMMTINPKDFEKYAMPLPMNLASDKAYYKQGARNPTMREAFMASGLTNEQWHELTDVQKMDVFNAFNKKQSKMAINEPMEFDQYLKHLADLKDGFEDVPFLQINKQEQGLPLTPFISGHEGRHRNRALAGRGEEKSLVQLLPRAELREPFPRRSQEEYLEALKKELEMTGNIVRPEAEDVYGNGQIQQIIRKPIQLPELYAEGGFTGEEGSTEDTPSKTRLMMEILARMAKEQAGEEVSSLKKPRAATDLLNRGVIAPLAGIPVDLINMGLEGVDAVRGLASGKPVENRLASDKPVLGSEYIMDLMRKYGMTTDTERPMMETALSVVSPSVGGAAKGVEKVGQAAKKGARAAESGLNATSAAMRRQYNARTKTN